MFMLFLMFLLITERSLPEALLQWKGYGSDGRPTSTIPVLCEYVLRCVSKANMRLKQAEVIKSSEYLPKLKSF